MKSKVTLEYVILIYITAIVFYGYYKRDNCKFFKFHMNNSSFFEIKASFFEALPSKKRRTLKVRH